MWGLSIKWCGGSFSLRYVQINSVPSGSTGSVMCQIHEERISAGDESWIMWGRGREASGDYEFNFGSKLGLFLDVLRTRVDGRAGFHSVAATKRLINKLDEINPDIIHLHNVHGYYVNIEMLFNWLAQRNQKVVWTLHDCWAFTGHCAHFTYTKCAQWQSHCARAIPCPQLSTYPKTISKDSPNWNYENKKRIFNLLPANRMTIITPSQWLADYVGKSYLCKYPIGVRHNTVDKSVFRSMLSDFRKRYDVDNRFVILGVASPWTKRKGLNDFFKLRRDLDEGKFAIVIVGLSDRQLADLPEGIIGIKCTDCQAELAEIYSAADVFFNPTYEDNFPTVNLEAEACGTPVLTYDTGGCRETISCPRSSVVPNYSVALVCLIDMEGNAVQ